MMVRKRIKHGHENHVIDFYYMLSIVFESAHTPVQHPIMHGERLLTE